MPDQVGYDAEDRLGMPEVMREIVPSVRVSLKTRTDGLLYGAYRAVLLSVGPRNPPFLPHAISGSHANMRIRRKGAVRNACAEAPCQT